MANQNFIWLIWTKTWQYLPYQIRRCFLTHKEFWKWMVHVWKDWWLHKLAGLQPSPTFLSHHLSPAVCILQVTWELLKQPQSWLYRLELEEGKKTKGDLDGSYTVVSRILFWKLIQQYLPKHYWSALLVFSSLFAIPNKIKVLLQATKRFWIPPIKSMLCPFTIKYFFQRRICWLCIIQLYECYHLPSSLVLDMSCF